MNSFGSSALVSTTLRLPVVVMVAITAISAGCGGSDSNTDGAPRATPSVVVSIPHTGLVFDPSRSLLYTVPFAQTAQIVSISALTGEQRVLLTSPRPDFYGSLSVSRSARYLYATGPTRNSATRFDLTTGITDLTINAPATTGPRSEFQRVIASPVDDSVVYAQLSGLDVSRNVTSFGMARDNAWQPRWVDIEAFSSGAKLAVRADAGELVSAFDNPPYLRLVQLRSDGAESVRAGVSVDPTTVSSQPHFTSQGILWGARVYEGSSLAVVFDIPGARHCAVLSSPDRVACVDGGSPGGHTLFVYDLRGRTRTAQWTAGFDSGSPSSVHAPLEVVAAGPGRLAISYGTFVRGGFGGSPSQVAIYSDAAFD